MITLSRRVHFSSGHRYYNPSWTEEKNKEVFGSSYSTHGHGHNYILEAQVKGDVNPETGMIMNLVDLDNILKDVSDLLDHKHLNNNVEYFKTITPTTENIAKFCFDKINSHLPKVSKASLYKVRVFEGDDLWADYYG